MPTVLDGQSRLTSATTSSHAASFVYDGRNRQLSRTMDGVTTWFVWDDWFLLAEYQLSGGAPVQVARYVHGPRLDEILVQSRGFAPTPVYLHEDALGSTYAATDATGAVVERYSYTAFGEVSAYDNAGAAMATSTTRFLYTGREWISEVGLNDHRNRFYMPTVGRWMSRDPIGERGGICLYCYVHNNPVELTDPLGLSRLGDALIDTSVVTATATGAVSGYLPRPVVAFSMFLSGLEYSLGRYINECENDEEIPIMGDPADSPIIPAEDLTESQTPPAAPAAPSSSEPEVPSVTFTMPPR